MYWLFITIALVLALLYFVIIKPLKYWERKNVPQRSVLKELNVMIFSFIRRQNTGDLVCDFYNAFQDKRYYGIYLLGSPVLLVRDIELIKQLTVKDFDSFMDHRPFLPDNSEPLWDNNLFSLKGEKWRQMRATLSPSFTSSKMKTMFVLMSQCAENFVEYFLENNSKIIEVDMLDIFTRYANDVIATTAFGIKCDSLRNRDNEFYLRGKEIGALFKGTWVTIKFMLYVLAPSIAKFFKLQLFSKQLANFFLNLIKNTIKTREENNIIRPDMIHLLMEARKGKYKETSTTNLPEAGFATVEEHIEANVKPANLTDTDITAQALIFFLAGFDTVSRSIAFIAYELGVNPDVQEKLFQEVDNILSEFDGKLTYEAIAKMKYLDMVISEGIRLWPNAILLDRTCVKSYTIKPERSDELPVTINAGESLWIPVMGIHRDPEFYPEPERFDPERFNDENKSNIKPFSFMPFGVGPRNCIGSRFALLEMKILIVYIISKFEIVPTEKTQIPLKLSAEDFNLYPLNGFKLGFKRRK